MIVLWLVALLLVLVLFMLGRSFGLFSVPFAIGLFYFILRYTHAGSEVVAAYAVAWLLLLSGVRTAIGHGIHSGEADALRSRTHLPRGLWWLLWLAGTLAALIIGGKLLVLRRRAGLVGRRQRRGQSPAGVSGAEYG